MTLQALQDYFRGQAGNRGAADNGLHFLDDGAFGRFGGMMLSSVFQPLVAAHTHRPAAFEALLRADRDDGTPVPLDVVFAQPRTPEEILYFDRLCRSTHAVNFQLQADAESCLFLNIDGRHLVSLEGGNFGSTFEALLAHCGLTPHQVVLEIVESRIENLPRLIEAVAAYQRKGYRVAIDDFGCAHSNFDRLWLLSPDIVKLDRSLIVEAMRNGRARKILPKIIDIVHELGAQAVCEGIETAEQDRLATDAGADLLQGFYYGLPSPRLKSGRRRLEVKQARAAKERAAAPA
jgi:EAL domain-containing protein (putative c-di-GMP-specific phosphodiesterase class I)